jgi:hypothetical protein
MGRIPILAAAFVLLASAADAVTFEGRIEGEAKLKLKRMDGQKDAVHADVALGGDACFSAVDQDGVQLGGSFVETKVEKKKTKLEFQFDPAGRDAMREIIQTWTRELVQAETGIDTEIEVTLDAVEVKGVMQRRKGKLTAHLHIEFTATAPDLGESRSGTYNATLSGKGGSRFEGVCGGETADAPTLSLAPSSAGSFEVEMSYPWPLIASNIDRYELEESTSSPADGFSVVYIGDRESPHSVTLSRGPGTYYYRVRAYLGFDATPYSGVTQHVVTQAARTLVIENFARADRNLDAVVQVKIALSHEGVFTAPDLLTDELPECYGLPGDEIAVGQSRRINLFRSDYYVFIGLGTWETNDFTCTDSRPWSKRTWFQSPASGLHWVWQVVRMTGHESGEAVWTLSGDYLDGTLAVHPEGNPPIPFAVTPWDPVP